MGLPKRADKQNEKRADWWERVIAIATVCVAVVGIVATTLYNRQQERFREIETVEKFFPHLISQDDRIRNMAVETIRSLANKQLADRVVNASVSSITELAATQLQPLARVPPPSPAGTNREGWVYLGDHSSTAHMWNTRYLNFQPTADPDQLSGMSLQVRIEVGSLNVRLGMPTPEGRFLEVIDVLKPGATVTLLEVRSWQATGFTWARISYVGR